MVIPSCSTRYTIEILERRLNRSRAAIALGDHRIELAPPGGDEGNSAATKTRSARPVKYRNNTARRHCYRRKDRGLRSTSPRTISL